MKFRGKQLNLTGNFTFFFPFCFWSVSCHVDPIRQTLLWLVPSPVGAICVCVVTEVFEWYLLTVPDTQRRTHSSISTLHTPKWTHMLPYITSQPQPHTLYAVYSQISILFCTLWIHIITSCPSLSISSEDLYFLWGVLLQSYSDLFLLFFDWHIQANSTVYLSAVILHLLTMMFMFSHFHSCFCI